MNKSISLVDTNLFIHAHNKKSSYHSLATKFIKKQVNQGLILTPQTILEFYNAITNPRINIHPTKANAIIKFYINHKKQIIYPKNNSWRKSLSFAIKNSVKGKAKIYDFYLAFTALDNGVSIIYTQNTKDFKNIPRLHAINPLK